MRAQLKECAVEGMVQHKLVKLNEESTTWARVRISDLGPENDYMLYGEIIFMVCVTLELFSIRRQIVEVS